ncbi:MAG TPA: hypothetical protein PLY88_03365 [Candidatus Omnitrophota bacterium]|nr:hypothetical protein [Candidatus Omnitrophota bacterium]
MEAQTNFISRFKSPGKNYFFLGIFLASVIWLLSGISVYAEDTVKIKIVAVNPSATQSLKSVVAQYLPPEVGPEDILDSEGFEVKYDSEKRAYLIRKEVELEPRETKTIEVRLKNVWVIEPEQIEEVKTQLKNSMEALSRTKFSETGRLLFEKANEVLAQIEENQTKQVGVMQRIELYRFNIKQLEDLQQNAISLEAMRRLEEEKKTGVREIKYVITAENPASEEKTLTVRSELPRDIQAKDVLEKGDFALVFDNAKLVFALEKEDVLAPKETKKYQVVLRDVWHISPAEIDFLKGEAEKIVPLFKKSPYEAFALKQGDLINKNLNDITLLQAEVASSAALEDRMRAHVLNSQREKFVKRKIKELQDLLSEVKLKPTEEDLASQIQQLVKKIADINKLVIMAMGMDPKKPIIWLLFFGIIGFLALITIVFYAAWLKKLQENKWVQPKGKAESKPDAEQGAPKT